MNILYITKRTGLKPLCRLWYEYPVIFKQMLDIIDNVHCNVLPKVNGKEKQTSVFILEYERPWKKCLDLLLISYLHATDT